jgi:hypothetical protein
MPVNKRSINHEPPLPELPPEPSEDPDLPPPDDEFEADALFISSTCLPKQDTLNKTKSNMHPMVVFITRGLSL